MRDINRLDAFYENLKAIHKNYIPDWRFGQFILNFMEWYVAKYRRDLFYVEEDKMALLLREFIDDLGIKYI